MERRRGGPAGRVRALLPTALLLVTVGLAGCGVPQSGPSPSPTGAAAATDLPELQRRATGGMCPEGPCKSVLVVEPDGRWTLTTEAKSTPGELTGRQRSEIAAAYNSTDRGATASPRPPCQADSDGTTVTYVWRLDGVTGSASTCDPAMDARDPLVRLLDDLAMTG